MDKKSNSHIWIKFLEKNCSQFAVKTRNIHREFKFMMPEMNFNFQQFEKLEPLRSHLKLLCHFLNAFTTFLATFQPSLILSHSDRLLLTLARQNNNDGKCSSNKSIFLNRAVAHQRLLHMQEFAFSRIRRDCSRGFDFLIKCQA